MAIVVAAMSGGVDSTVAASMMRDAGHDVLGVTLRTWDCELDPSPARARGRTCCGRADAADAVAAARALGIPHREVDARDVFLQEVIEPSREAQRRGLTPNPCILCNEHVKFGFLISLLGELDADRLVTGHYARLASRPGRIPALCRARDRSRDQAYVLFSLAGTERLARLDFPLGALRKDEVRRMASALDLPNALKPESQDLCFPVRDPGEDRPGEIVDVAGRVLGTHDGLSLYTLGQHRRLRVRGSEKVFVLALDPVRNLVVVGDEQGLMASGVVARLVSWDGDPPTRTMPVTTRIRYRQDPVEATASVSKGRILVRFGEPQRAVTPGQALVLYEGDRVLGGGWILSSAWPP